MLLKRNSKLLACPLFTNPKMVASGPRARFKIASNRACGATSITIAFSGTCFNASWQIERKGLKWEGTNEERIKGQYPSRAPKNLSQHEYTNESFFWGTKRGLKQIYLWVCFKNWQPNKKIHVKILYLAIYTGWAKRYFT